MKKETYDFTPEMDEISGFGGGYERACRKMLKAGLEWMDKHPDEVPVYMGFENVFGLFEGQNRGAKALDRVLLKACPDQSGAMHQAVVQAIFYVRKHGWKAYVKEMSKKD